MMFDTLETRRLMSVSLNAATHVLTIQGTAGYDAITVDVADGKVKVTDNGVQSSFAKAGVAKVVAFGKAGNDFITLTPNVFIPSELHSGTVGDPNGDKLQGGSGKDAIFLEDVAADGNGGAGDDALVVFGDSNIARGQAGNDTIKLTGEGTYSGDNGFNGGPGVDTIDYSNLLTGVFLQNGPSGPYILFDGGVPGAVGDTDGIAEFENFTGGQGDDYLYGTSGPNVLRGNGGADVIKGRAGDDKAYGGAGADALFGEDGNDFLQGDAGNDFLSAGAGADSLNGNDGDDVFYSKDGNQDFLAGGAGTDKATRGATDVVNSVEQSQF
jgi:Ca2+-binding RTX toxin-like protein